MMFLAGKTFLAVLCQNLHKRCDLKNEFCPVNKYRGEHYFFNTSFYV